jgi:hypothetical protein
MKITKTHYLSILACGLAVRAWVFAHLPRTLATCATDYSPFYAAGRLLGSPHIYDPAAIFDVLDRTVGCHAAWAVWIKPPFYAAFMWPLAQLPFDWALWIWRALGVCALAGFVWLWPGNRFAAAAMLAWFLPVAANFTAGQDVAFVLLFVMAGYRLVERRRLFAAGLVLGLCAVKFHLFLFLPVLLIQKRLWRTCAGAATTATVLAGLSFAAGGPHWIPHYLAALRTLGPFYDSGGFAYPNLRCLFHGYSPAFFLAAAFTLLIVWLLIRSASLAHAFAAVIIGGLLLAPHSTLCDLTLLAPVMLPAAARSGLARYPSLLLMTPLPALIFGGVDTWVVLMMLLLFLLWYEMSRAGATRPVPADTVNPAPHAIPLAP